VILSSCSKKPAQKSTPANSPMAESIRFQYAVYMLPIHAKNPSFLLRNALVNKYVDLKQVDEAPKEPRGMFVSAHLQKTMQRDYPPPNMESLVYSGSGISRQQAQVLQKS
jgi:hypothetical protein